MENKIVIIGTDHKLQCRSTANKFKPEQHEKYGTVVEMICKNFNIKLIAEEMNNDGLDENGVDETIASKIARNMCIRCENIDIELDLREKLYVKEENFVSYSMNLTKKFKLEDTRFLLEKNLLHPIRERYWLARILDFNIWPTLFICGVEHANNMVTLINSVLQGPVTSWIKCCPGEDGSIV